MPDPKPPAANAVLYKKIAWRVLPFLFICYVVNFIDRVNIGFAKLEFVRDLHLNDQIYGIAAGLFFIGYFLFEIPSNVALERIGARKTLARIMLLWGACTIALMFVKGEKSLYVLRFLLGAAEAGFFPGIILYLTYWFPNRWRGRCTSLFLLGVPIAGIIGGPLSGWIMSGFHEIHGLRGWQWLFLLEGIPAMILGVLAMVVLTDKPEQARWLSPDEKKAVATELELERLRQPAASAARKHDFRAAFHDRYVYIFVVIYFSMFLFLNAVGFWIPTILRGVGAQSLEEVGLLHGLISLATAIGMVLIGRSSDRHLERRWHAALSGFGATVAFLLLPLASHSVPLTTVLLALASIGIFGVQATFWTLPATFLKPATKAVGIAAVSAIGAIGGFVSPSLVGTLKVSTGSIYFGLAIIGLLLALGMLVLLLFIPKQPAVKPA